MKPLTSWNCAVRPRVVRVMSTVGVNFVPRVEKPPLFPNFPNFGLYEMKDWRSASSSVSAVLIAPVV